MAQEGVLEQIEALKVKAAQEQDVYEKSLLLYDIGDLYYSNQRDSSIFYLTQAYHLSQNSDDLEFRSKVAALLGMAYQVVDMEQSTTYLFEGLELAEEHGDKFLISYNYNIIGTHYRIVGELDKAEKYCKKSIDLKVDIKDSIGIAFCYNNLGIIYMMQAEYDKGLDFWMKSLDMKLLLGDSLGAANTMSNIGIYYKDIGRTEEALDYFNKGLEMELKVNSLDRASHSYQYLGDLHMSTQNYSSAITSYKMSIELMDSIGMLFDKREPLLGMSKAYEKSNNYKMAYETLLTFQELNAAYQDSSKSKITRELAAKYEVEQKEKENALLKSANDAKDARIKEEEAQIALKEANNRYLWIGLALVFITLVLIAIALSRVRNAKAEIETQKHIVEAKNREITDSISYAQRLQKAILPPRNTIDKEIGKNFVFYLPKDIVAGDFYWMEPRGERILFAVADCTGHGVPGAFVSFVCHNALNRAVREFNLERPSEILDKVTDLVIETFATGNQDVKDGMDISLCAYNPKTGELEYAGANNSFYFIRNGELNEIKPTKQPVGKYDARGAFVNNELRLEPKDVFYLFTDGFADQFGGEKGKKFKYKNFKKLLVDIHTKPPEEQRKILRKRFIDWMGDNEQVDDVCIAGIWV